MGKENMKEPVPRNLPPTPFPGHLKKQMGSPYRTHETVRITGNPEEIHNEKAQEEDMDVGWDIKNKDVERLRNRSRIRINKWYQSFALRNFDLEDMEFEYANSMLAIDGVGFDRSDMAEEQVQTNMALMVFSDSEVYTDKTCSKTCLKNYETLKKQCDDLIVKLNQTEFTAATYKKGLAIVKEQLIKYRKNEVLFSEEVAVLKKEVACKNYEINVLKSEFEKVKQEKKGIEFKIEKFDKASKDLDKLLGSQITDKSKKGLGYSAVPPPHPLIYNRPNKLDLSYSGLDEFKEPEFKGYGNENSKKESNVGCNKKSDDSKENSDNSLVKEQVSKDTSSFVESSLNVDKETVFPVDKKVESVKPKNHEKPIKKSVRVNYNYTTKMTHPNAQRNMVPRAVLIKTGLKPFNTARTVNNTAHSKSTVFCAKPMSCFPKTAHSIIRRPFQTKIAVSNKRFTHKANTAKAQAVNTIRLNSTVVRVNQENVVKASACWVWRPTKPNGASITLKKHNYIDARGRSKLVKRGRDIKIPQSNGPPIKVGDEAVHKELGSGPKCQDTILGDVDAQTRFETTSKQSNDPPLSRVNAVKPNLVLPVQVNAAEGDSINTSI
ncbi:hypothetical protein Tco_1147074 [Tanacetum coccineum]